MSKRTNTSGTILDFHYAPDASLNVVRYTRLDQERNLFQALSYDEAGLLFEGHFNNHQFAGQWNHDSVTKQTRHTRLCLNTNGKCSLLFNESRSFADNGLLLDRSQNLTDLQNADHFEYSDRGELIRSEHNGSDTIFKFNEFGGIDNPEGNHDERSRLLPQLNGTVFDTLGRLQKSSEIDAIVYTESDRPLNIQKGSEVLHLGYDAQGKLSYRLKNTENGSETIFLVFDDTVETRNDSIQTLVLPGSMQVILDTRISVPTFQWLDMQGSPQASFDEFGNVSEIFKREIHGYREPASKSNEQLMPVDFAGQRLDTDSGLIFWRSRWYNPQAGLFTSPDTRVMEQPELCLASQWMDCNLYGFPANNPAGR